MSALLQRWDFDDTTEWLRPVDLFLGIELLRAAAPADAAPAGDPGRAVLEIGVWKGAWLLAVTGSSEMVDGVGVDPYPGSPGLREQVVRRAVERGIGDRLTLVATPADVCTSQCSGRLGHRSFALIHIDGLHAERQVSDDLSFAAQHAAQDAVIIVDDYLHPAYPGVASAMYQFLARREHAIFLVTRNKAYLCRADQHGQRLASTCEMLDRAGLGWERHRGGRSGARYLQPPDVMGFPMALCLDEANDARVLDGIPRPARVRARRQVDRWVPPAARDSLRPVKHLFEGATARSHLRR